MDEIKTKNIQNDKNQINDENIQNCEEMQEIKKGGGTIVASSSTELPFPSYGQVINDSF